jgi:hypothetical protein
MKTDSEHPAFSIRCVKCNAEVGESCGSWEGAPTICMDRFKLAEELFGKFRFVNGKYVKV